MSDQQQQSNYTNFQETEWNQTNELDYGINSPSLFPFFGTAAESENMAMTPTENGAFLPRLNESGLKKPIAPKPNIEQYRQAQVDYVQIPTPTTVPPTPVVPTLPSQPRTGISNIQSTVQIPMNAIQIQPAASSSTQISALVSNESDLSSELAPHRNGFEVDIVKAGTRSKSCWFGGDFTATLTPNRSIEMCQNLSPKQSALMMVCSQGHSQGLKLPRGSKVTLTANGNLSAADQTLIGKDLTDLFKNKLHTVIAFGLINGKWEKLVDAKGMSLIRFKPDPTDRSGRRCVICTRMDIRPDIPWYFIFPGFPYANRLFFQYFYSDVNINNNINSTNIVVGSGNGNQGYGGASSTSTTNAPPPIFASTSTKTKRQLENPTERITKKSKISNTHKSNAAKSIPADAAKLTPLAHNPTPIEIQAKSTPKLPPAFLFESFPENPVPIPIVESDDGSFNGKVYSDLQFEIDNNSDLSRIGVEMEMFESASLPNKQQNSIDDVEAFTIASTRFLDAPVAEFDINTPLGVHYSDINQEAMNVVSF